MTIATMFQIKDELGKRGITAYVEHPGFLSISTKTTTRLSFGDINDSITVDALDPNDNVDESHDSDIPSDTTDVKRCADFIACLVTEYEEL